MMMVERFPEDVVMEILSWVPVKSLLRFRSVSKSWFRLLTNDSHFIKLHLNRLIQANSKTSIMFLRKTHFHFAEDYTECDKAIELDVPFNMVPIKYTVSGICDGLLCLSDNVFESRPEVFIWNPITKDYITIPCSPIPSHFLTTNRSIIFGFGFHQVTNEYKVIRIIFTCLRVHSWRDIERISHNIIFTPNFSFSNGAIHWVVAMPGSVTWNQIVSFDLKDEVFQEIPLPKGVSYYDDPAEDFYDIKIGEFDGNLCLFCTYIEEDVHIQIWVMKEYGVISSWSNQYKIGEAKTWSSYLEPLGVARSGEIIIREDKRQLAVYDPKTNSVKSLQEFGLEFDLVYAYIGSLVSPRLINGASLIT
ncbi:hypothetical protein AQUCO_07200041v1 [Aquilegia coerulea]|uniref:F-box domain-containing protein n=1 Tax=Aquilegia coerulea TaxID=218851 RepID=A0A2G5CA41_AQUCA|nr:hypothetical protein AQUCO_07200041v1 [Aquilegia coerulea]